MNQNEGVAAWTQTIGSIIALAIAILIPVYQSRQAKQELVRAAVDKQYTQVNFIWGSATTVVEEIEALRSYLNEEPYPVGKELADQGKTFENILLSFDAFPIHDLGTGPLVTAALALRRDCHKLVAKMISALSEAQAHMTPGKDVDLTLVDSQLESVKQQLSSWTDNRNFWFKKVYQTD